MLVHEDETARIDEALAAATAFTARNGGSHLG
jgi:hypothetical protein